jgi:hypothetical protein
LRFLRSVAMASGADEDRLALLVALEQLGDHGCELLALGLVDDVLVVGADHRLVGRDDDDAELVGLVELGRLGLRRPRHSA